jgi:ABC-2 type transport system ATP-binding protein
VDKGEEAVPQVLRLLDSNGLAPSTMDLHRPSLDDVFLKKTGRSLRETAA